MISPKISIMPIMAFDGLLPTEPVVPFALPQTLADIAVPAHTRNPRTAKLAGQRKPRWDPHRQIRQRFQPRVHASVLTAKQGQRSFSDAARELSVAAILSLTQSKPAQKPEMQLSGVVGATEAQDFATQILRNKAFVINDYFKHSGHDRAEVKIDSKNNLTFFCNGMFTPSINYSEGVAALQRVARGNAFIYEFQIPSVFFARGCSLKKYDPKTQTYTECTPVRISNASKTFILIENEYYDYNGMMLCMPANTQAQGLWDYQQATPPSYNPVFAATLLNQQTPVAAARVGINGFCEVFPGISQPAPTPTLNAQQHLMIAIRYDREGRYMAKFLAPCAANKVFRINVQGKREQIKTQNDDFRTNDTLILQAGQKYLIHDQIIFIPLIPERVRASRATNPSAAPNRDEPDTVFNPKIKDFFAPLPVSDQISTVWLPKASSHITMQTQSSLPPPNSEQNARISLLPNGKYVIGVPQSWGLQGQLFFKQGGLWIPVTTQQVYNNSVLFTISGGRYRLGMHEFELPEKASQQQHQSGRAGSTSSSSYRAGAGQQTGRSGTSQGQTGSGSQSNTQGGSRSSTGSSRTWWSTHLRSTPSTSPVTETPEQTLARKKRVVNELKEDFIALGFEGHFNGGEPSEEVMALTKRPLKVKIEKDLHPDQNQHLTGLAAKAVRDARAAAYRTLNKITERMIKEGFEGW